MEIDKGTITQPLSPVPIDDRASTAPISSQHVNLLLSIAAHHGYPDDYDGAREEYDRVASSDMSPNLSDQDTGISVDHQNLLLEIAEENGYPRDYNGLLNEISKRSGIQRRKKILTTIRRLVLSALCVVPTAYLMSKAYIEPRTSEVYSESVDTYQYNPSFVSEAKNILKLAISELETRFATEVDPLDPNYAYDTNSYAVDLSQPCADTLHFPEPVPPFVNQFSVSRACKPDIESTRRIWVLAQNVFIDSDNVIYINLPDLSENPFFPLAIKIDPSGVATLLTNSVFGKNSSYYFDTRIQISAPEIQAMSLRIRNLYDKARSSYESLVDKYRQTNVLSPRLSDQIRESLIETFTGSTQYVQRAGSEVVARENFITPEMAEQIANGFIQLSSYLNIDMVDLSNRINRITQSRSIVYVVLSPGAERGEVHVSSPTGEIYVWGDSDSIIANVLIHEFMHALMQGHFPHQFSIPQYREGTTELLTQLATIDIDRSSFTAYPESTILTVASGLWQRIVANANSDTPIKFDDLFDDTSDIATIARYHWDFIAQAHPDVFQRIFLYPQADEYILDSYGRSRDSVTELKYYPGYSWAALKPQLIEQVTSLVEDENSRSILHQRLTTLWSYL